MKSFLSSAVVILALYAQAASAGNLSVWESSNEFGSHSSQTLQSTFSLIKLDNEYQVIGLTAVNKTRHNFITETNKSYGFGIGKTSNSGITSQLTVEGAGESSMVSTYLRMAVIF